VYRCRPQGGSGAVLLSHSLDSTKTPACPTTECNRISAPA
jgi:hypothetical protein